MTHREVRDIRIGLGLEIMYKWCTQSNGNSIEFSLSNTDKGTVGLILALELASLTLELNSILQALSALDPAHLYILLYQPSVTDYHDQ